MRTARLEQGEFQRQFHQRWSVLRDPHVRALAWLLDAPDLLDAQATCWEGRVVQLEQVDDALTSWLLQLDAAPQALHAIVNQQASARLGRYAEKLLTFYLQHTNRLVAHNAQIHTARNQTVGEFDFLLRDVAKPGKILHWELATKFYLLAFADKGTSTEAMDTFVGPNLADSLAAKLQKIMKQQLMLSSHPAAQGLIWKVDAAQALVKAWLFYPEAVFSSGAAPTISGISVNHCRGFWCSLSDFVAQSEQAHTDYDEEDVPSVHYVIMPRLSWLAPLRCERQQTLSLLQLCEALMQHFLAHLEPVLIAVCTEEQQPANDNGSQEAIMLERQRGFIVPDDWSRRAQEYVLGRRTR